MAKPAFRDREHATIARLAAGDALVLALGGGAIERAETRDLLLTTPGTLLVHLEVELATTLARCSGTEHTRPVLADQANLASRYQRRLPLYRTAHVSIAVDALTPERLQTQSCRPPDWANRIPLGTTPLAIISTGFRQRVHPLP